MGSRDSLMKFFSSAARLRTPTSTHRADLQHPPCHRCVAPAGPKVLVFKVGVGVQVEDRKVGVGLCHVLHRAYSNGVLASEQRDELTFGGDGFYRTPHPVHHGFWTADVGHDFGRRVYPYERNIAVQLQVVVLQVPGRGDDRAWSVACSALVRGSAVVGDRDYDDPRRRPVGFRRRRVEEGLPVDGDAVPRVRVAVRASPCLRTGVRLMRSRTIPR